MKYEKKLGLTPIRHGGGANFAPQFTKNQLLNNVASWDLVCKPIPTLLDEI